MVYKRGDVWWYEFRFNGKRIRKTTKQGNRRIAEQIEAARQTQLAKDEVGILDRAPAPTLKEFGVTFMKQIEIDCASKPQTIGFYRIKLKRLLEHAKLAEARIDQIEENAIEAYKRARRQFVSRHGRVLSPASVNRELATLRRLPRMAHEWKKLNRVPRIRLLRGENAREFVLSSELEPKCLDALPASMRALVAFLIDTGLRIGEGLTLDWRSVNPRGHPGYLQVRAVHSKNSGTRTVPLTDRARRILEARQERSGLIFRGEDGGPLYHTWLDQQHADVRAALGLPADFVLHSLRHTFGTRLGETGADAFTIMRLMGHSSVTVSQKYVHPSTASMESAIERLGRAGLPTNSPTEIRMVKRKNK